jgi:hypothetical protein
VGAGALWGPSPEMRLPALIDQYALAKELQLDGAGLHSE